jgi:deoxyadenosine/deoxycytidine kinase
MWFLFFKEELFMKVYVIAGKAGCGKNTTANYIKNYYKTLGKETAITEISKYLKLFAYEIKDWDGKRETKPRSFLQEVGSTIRHEIYSDDFLINRFLEDLKIYERFVDVVIVDDARFPREIELIKEKCNAVSIRVVNEFSDYELQGSLKMHETETSLDNFDKFDYVIHNKTFESLKNDAENIVREVER